MKRGAPFGRDLLLRMCNYYMNQNDNGVFVRRLVLITTFLVVGRAGEIGENFYLLLFESNSP